MTELLQAKILVTNFVTNVAVLYITITITYIYSYKVTGVTASLTAPSASAVDR